MIPTLAPEIAMPRLRVGAGVRRTASTLETVAPMPALSVAHAILEVPLAVAAVETPIPAPAIAVARLQEAAGAPMIASTSETVVRTPVLNAALVTRVVLPVEEEDSAVETPIPAPGTVEARHPADVGAPTIALALETVALMRVPSAGRATQAVLLEVEVAAEASSAAVEETTTVAPETAADRHRVAAGAHRTASTSETVVPMHASNADPAEPARSSGDSLFHLNSRILPTEWSGGNLL